MRFTLEDSNPSALMPLVFMVEGGGGEGRGGDESGDGWLSGRVCVMLMPSPKVPAGLALDSNVDVRRMS